MSVSQTPALITALSTACNLSTIITVIAKAVTWDDTAKTRSISAQIRRVRMEEFAPLCKRATIASAWMASMAKAANFPDTIAIPILA